MDQSQSGIDRLLANVGPGIHCMKALRCRLCKKLVAYTDESQDIVNVLRVWCVDCALPNDSPECPVCQSPGCEYDHGQ